jgi:vancomycin resistance protein VanJ
MFSRWRWLLIALLLPILVAFFILYGEMLLPVQHSAATGHGSELSVVTYNMLSIDSEPERVVNVIQQLDADIVGLLELGPDHAQLIDETLADEYPYRALHPSLPYNGIGVLSRYPIRDDLTFSPLPDSMGFQRVVVDLNGTSIVVYVAHPRPGYNIFSPLTYNNTIRDQEIRILIDEYLDHETGPLLVIGDFNMPDLSDAYGWMDRRWTDAFREAGHGLGFTFPAPLRFVRIDYIWHDEYFVAKNAEVGDDNGTSDHHPVLARLILKESDANPSTTGE